MFGRRRDIRCVHSFFCQILLLSVTLQNFFHFPGHRPTITCSDMVAGDLLHISQSFNLIRRIHWPARNLHIQFAVYCSLRIHYLSYGLDSDHEFLSSLVSASSYSKSTSAASSCRGEAGYELCSEKSLISVSIPLQFCRCSTVHGRRYSTDTYLGQTQWWRMFSTWAWPINADGGMSTGPSRMLDLINMGLSFPGPFSYAYWTSLKSGGLLTSHSRPKSASTSVRFFSCFPMNLITLYFAWF